MKNRLFGKLQSKIIAILVSLIFPITTSFAQEDQYKYKHAQVKPDSIPVHSSSEYYSSVPDAKVQIPINIWGEVKNPGIYYVPLGASVRHSISAAGGPTGLASMPTITIIRNGKTDYIHLLKDGDRITVNELDTYIVERSFYKADLPSMLGVISAILGIVSVSIAISKK